MQRAIWPHSAALFKFLLAGCNIDAMAIGLGTMTA